MPEGFNDPACVFDLDLVFVLVFAKDEDRDEVEVEAGVDAGRPRARSSPASMRRTLALSLAALAALALAGCSDSPCQKLGERLCTCTGQSGDTCQTQVEELLKKLDPPQSTLDECEQLLASCKEPEGAVFCEWVNTTNGKLACGVAPPR